MGKGSARRPSQVSEQQIAANWKRTFATQVADGRTVDEAEREIEWWEFASEWDEYDRDDDEDTIHPSTFSRFWHG